MFSTNSFQPAASLLALSRSSLLRRRQLPPQPVAFDKATANTVVEKTLIVKKWAACPDKLRH